MTLDGARTAIVNVLKADMVLNALGVDVRTHRGRFTMDDLKTVSARSMSVLVACLAVQDVALKSGLVDCRCIWGAFILSTDKPQMARDAGALMILTRLLKKIPGNLWGLDISAPADIEAQNLYAAKTDEKGVVIWAVTWAQDVSLPLTEIEEAEDLADLLQFAADYDVAPKEGNIVASDDVRLPASE